MEIRLLRAKAVPEIIDLQKSEREITSTADNFSVKYSHAHPPLVNEHRIAQTFGYQQLQTCRYLCLSVSKVSSSNFENNINSTRFHI